MCTDFAESSGWIMRKRRSRIKSKRRELEVIAWAECMCGCVCVWQSARLKRREIVGERRGALVKVLVVICCGVLATFPLPDWMFYERCRIRKGGRLIIQLTEVFLWWMSRGAGGRGGGRCNKAECISPGMKLQQLGGGRREREGCWSATNISVWLSTSACVHHMSRYACVCDEGEAFCSEPLLTSVCWTITLLVQCKRH